MRETTYSPSQIPLCLIATDRDCNRINDLVRRRKSRLPVSYDYRQRQREQFSTIRGSYKYYKKYSRRDTEY